MQPPQPVIGVVGPCCAGKSTLVQALSGLGRPARHIAQEHSFAPRMWQIIGQPDVLVFLDVSYPVAQQRRWMDWQPQDWEEQQRRLRHAREHCDLYIHTDPLSAQEVLQQVLHLVSS
jgi:cytidylate kinase